MASRGLLSAQAPPPQRGRNSGGGRSRVRKIWRIVRAGQRRPARWAGARGPKRSVSLPQRTQVQALLRKGIDLTFPVRRDCAQTLMPRAEAAKNTDFAQRSPRAPRTKWRRPPSFATDREQKEGVRRHLLSAISAFSARGVFSARSAGETLSSRNGVDSDQAFTRSTLPLNDPGSLASLHHRRHRLRDRARIRTESQHCRQPRGWWPSLL